MKKQVEIYLQDIIESIELIQKRTKGITQETLETDIDLQDMVIHRLEIIGEAVKNIPKEFRLAHPEILWHQPAGMRDKLIHGYDSVDLTIVWDTVKKVLPTFKKQIKSLVDY